jgi:Tfp pilus assembly protein PilN
MIEINLLPGAGKKKAAKRQALDVGAMTAGVTGRLKDKFMIGAIASVVVAALTIGVMFTAQAAKDSSLSDHRDHALRDSTRYANFLKERYRAESVRDSLLRQVHLIQSLDEDRFVWPHIMDEVSRALPQYTWITSIAFTGTPQGSNNVVAGPKSAADSSAAAKKADHPPKRMDTTIPKDVITLRIVGRTVDIQAVTRFYRDLEASPFLGNVQLEKSEAAVDQGKEIAQFQFTLGFTRPDTLMLHRVPLSLSVK